MLDTAVKKMIARDGEREVIDSSYEEMEKFITLQMRPDFKDTSILCIKFLITVGDSLTDAEETSWFINPYYIREPDEFEEGAQDPAFPDFSQDYSYGAKMASEFLPEILLINTTNLKRNILECYHTFYVGLMYNGQTDLSDEEKYNLFIEELQNPDYQ